MIVSVLVAKGAAKRARTFVDDNEIQGGEGHKGVGHGVEQDLIC